MRSKVLVLGLASVLTLVLAVGGATLALFTAQSSNDQNTFTSGTIAISNTDNGTWSAFFNNMAPGDMVSKVITVQNTGSLQLEFVTVPTRSGALFSGDGRATVTVLSGSGLLDPGATQDVTVQVALPLTAGNPYQNVSGSLDLLFTAYQTANITTEAATITAAGSAPPWDIYKFYAPDGTQISLTASHIIAFTETRPDGSVISLPIGDDSDPNFYFHQSKPSGVYHYEVMALNGVKYTGSITRP